MKNEIVIYQSNQLNQHIEVRIEEKPFKLCSVGVKPL